MARYVISAVAVALERFLSSVPGAEGQVDSSTIASATVCAEYRGPRAVTGTTLTLSKSDLVHPVLRPNDKVQPLVTVAGKEFNLVFVGAALSLDGLKPEAPEGFWELVAFVDLNGLKKIQKSGATPENIRRYYAFQGWLQWWLSDHELAHETVHDVTSDMWAAVDFLECIFANSPMHLEYADQFESSLAPV